MINKIKDWLFKVNVSVYPCIPMTGKTGRQVWRMYREQRLDYAREGVSTISPVPAENIKANHRLVGDRRGIEAIKIWNKDGIQIQKAPVIAFEKRCMNSQGSIAELTKGRGSLFKITVFIHPKPGFISRAQYDICATTRKKAAKEINRRFGTRYKRIKYRLFTIWPRFIFKGIPRLLMELFK